MKPTTSDALLHAIAQLRQLFPEWRLGQLMANLTTTAGYAEPEAIWDVEDDRLLAVAKRLIVKNKDRQQT